MPVCPVVRGLDVGVVWKNPPDGASSDVPATKAASSAALAPEPEQLAQLMNASPPETLRLSTAPVAVPSTVPPIRTGGLAAAVPAAVGPNTAPPPPPPPPVEHSWPDVFCVSTPCLPAVRVMPGIPHVAVTRALMAVWARTGV